MIYPTLDELLLVGEVAIGGPPQVTDQGLLISALARPSAIAFGDEAYPTAGLKAAALLHSIACNHALLDGNKRLALGAALLFLGLNDLELAMTEDAAYALVMDVANGRLREVGAIAERLIVRRMEGHESPE